MNYIFTNSIKDDNALRRSYNSLAEKTFGLSFEEFYQNGYWTDKYIPYSLIDDGKVIANASVNILKSFYNGQEKRCIQIGTVMTDSDYRNQGLSRYLIERILSEWKEACDTMYLFANDSVLDFYPKFGFVKAVEYQCSSPITPTKGRVRKLDMSHASDREFLKRYYTKSNPYSALAIKDNYELFMFYCTSLMKDCVYFLEDFDAVIIASNKNEILTCYDIFSDGNHAMIEMVSRVAESQIRTVVFGFTPAEHAAFHSQILEEEDTTLFILKGKDNWFVNHQMMFPVLSHA
ncbi:Acetyltransferase (GNAT) domain-containing protein [Lacrimispora sphenoides]|jgi:GNAT superfamily N-acetyltransferase|uniref:GNAT family N-acetyltransferase n=1 Tax=Lacrimispora sphenoides TaxID=29370 RepID=UPI0008BCE1C0|nr:GNAT family N-acetyltransferase [Lacrimispora sphenoides]SEU02223.1 Acetyltransferase (GNAT) domain-containing protein [Lacrimispora sphenoides]